VRGLLSGQPAWQDRLRQKTCRTSITPKQHKM
jgi:hypothetical protein